jgi:hypothetical protein
MGGPQSSEGVVECPMRQYWVSTTMGFCLDVRGDGIAYHGTWFDID